MFAVHFNSSSRTELSFSVHYVLHNKKLTQILAQPQKKLASVICFCSPSDLLRRWEQLWEASEQKLGWAFLFKHGTLHLSPCKATSLWLFRRFMSQSERLPARRSFRGPKPPRTSLTLGWREERPEWKKAKMRGDTNLRAFWVMASRADRWRAWHANGCFLWWRTWAGNNRKWS